MPSKVRSISLDSGGAIWFGGPHGLVSLKGETVRQFGAADGVGDLDLTVIQQFPDGGVIARIPRRQDVAGGIPDVAIPFSQRHSVFLAAREALNNIVKHSQATEVILRIRVLDGVLRIRISASPGSESLLKRR